MPRHTAAGSTYAAGAVQESTVNQAVVPVAPPLPQRWAIDVIDDRGDTKLKYSPVAALTKSGVVFEVTLFYLHPNPR